MSSENTSTITPTLEMSDSRIAQLVNTYNNLTHYPITAQKVRDEIRGDVQALTSAALSDLENWGIVGIPADVARAFEILSVARAHLFAETVRERTIAPPWTVVGPSNYRGNPERARRVYERASERWEAAKRLLARKLNRYNPNRAVRSDEAGAVERLKAKVATFRELQDVMKSANAVIRKGIDVETKLLALGISERNIHKLLNPTYSFERKGFQAWELSNNNANIKRLEDRIKTLEREASRKDEERIAVNGQGWECFEDTTEQRLCYRFDGKPSEEVRALLKSHGFKWSPSRLLWVRLLNNQARFSAIHYVNLKLPKA